MLCEYNTAAEDAFNAEGGGSGSGSGLSFL